MSGRRHVKLVKEGEYVAEVQVELIDDPDAWGPYLSVQDAEKLDRVRAALKASDTSTAGKLAKVYRLTPVSAG